jgi:hypothetical protein
VKDESTYVAPATTSSTVLALVDPDSIAMKMVVATIIVQSRADRSVRQLQIITGANSSVMMNGVIRMRANRAIDDLTGMWTFGSLERL